MVPDIRRTAELVQEISMASAEQSRGEEQLNLGVNQLDQVTQQNAMTAETLATSSEELSAQAKMLQQAIAFFHLDNAPNAQDISPQNVPAQEQHTNDSDKHESPEIDRNGYMIDMVHARHEEEQDDHDKEFERY